MSPPVIVAVVLAVLLLIAVVLLVIELRRTPGRPGVAGPAVTGPAALDEVDRALRVLVTACDRAERDFPDVYAVECAADRVVLRLATYETSAPEPWDGGGDGTEWTLSRAGRQTGGQVPAESHPYPLIASLGLHEDRRVLVNLARAAGPITLAGPPTAVGAFAQRLLTELLSGPVGRDAEVTLIGDVGIGLTGVRPERLRTAATLAEAQHGGREQQVARAGAGAVFQQLDDGRAAAEPDQPRRLVVIGADQYRAESAGRAPAGGAVLVLGEIDHAAWRFEVRPDGGLDTGALGLPIDTSL
ncbi:hypothetical protein [Actinoplanes couchii]|uniref:Uncharacterized protein n=1 Tax=Actinoplanes couchii TaxID=403638 RepID=A0ABQ3XD48_9ACTN|nr:hypothetical protein [Actinoplanes couchii]MDR6321333.1 hypothetical protein [Actinoplanes couchii]GID56443.1 hypothetical protein Aco03nite_048470 [Actinoplanes couchii]